MRSVEELYRADGVRIFRLDQQGVRARLTEAARRLLSENEEVLTVRLVGSLARGEAGPASDADLLIVLRESPLRFLDRAERFAPYFDDAGIGCDILVYTQSEVVRMREGGSALLRAAEIEGIVLAGRPQ